MTQIGSHAGVLTFLRETGLLSSGDSVDLTPLTGGVSSDLWKVDLPDRTICVKGALARLKVADEWLAPVSRNGVEYDWLVFASPLCPGQVPQVIAHDAAAGLFAMEFLPPSRYPVWKSSLLSGEVNVATAQQVGELTGRLHAASITDPRVPSTFATDENFDALRIGPFLHATAAAHPDLRDRLFELARRTAGTHLALVHGDVSPKNILLGPRGPVLLDAECAWWGDPAFDVAFCVNHLLIKSVKLPSLGDALRRAAEALAETHARLITWEPPKEFERRVASLIPALALARVDGTSPVEYLDAAQRQTIRGIARAQILEPPSTLDEVLALWSAHQLSR